MPRGKAAKVGDTNVSSNGYHYTRTTSEWRLTHHLVAEQLLGRKLNSSDMVRFKDGDKTNLNPSNVVVSQRPKKGKEARLAKLDAQIAELQAQRELLLLE